jgi:hypothetical protein
MAQVYAASGRRSASVLGIRMSADLRTAIKLEAAQHAVTIA